MLRIYQPDQWDGLDESDRFNPLGPLKSREDRLAKRVNSFGKVNTYKRIISHRVSRE